MLVVYWQSDQRTPFGPRGVYPWSEHLISGECRSRAYDQDYAQLTDIEVF